MKNKKKKKLFHIGKKGFTLIELLAVIMILSIVMGVVSYTVIAIISGVRDKTYQVTINNIEGNAGVYLTENKDKMSYVPNISNPSVEYNCITIQNLIELGYLSEDVTKSNVADGMTASKSDYIYIERDTDSKAILKTVYIGQLNGAYANMCKVSSLISGTVTFASQPALGEWSREKEVTITYRVRNVNTSYVRGYAYTYTGSHNLLEDNGTTKKVKITSNGDMAARVLPRLPQDGIPDDAYVAINRIQGTLNVSKIDIVKPVIELKNNTSGYVNNEVTIPLNVIDGESGIKEGSFDKSKISVTVGGTPISNNNITMDANYNLRIVDSEHSGDIVINIAANAVYDNAGNASAALDHPLEPNVKFDNSAPTAAVTSTENLKVAKQTATIRCTDNTGATAYYWGTNNNPANNLYTTFTSATDKTVQLEIVSAGTYYLICKDAAGNISNKASKTYYNYTVKNMLNTVDGTVGTYTTSNYAQITSVQYLAPKGTTITPASLYTVPSGSNANKYSGISSGARSTTAATLLTGEIKLDATTTYAIWFGRNIIHFRYQLQSGETFQENVDYNSNTYAWSKDSNNYMVLSKNDAAATNDFTKYKYGISTINLYNYNAALVISKTGYTGKSGAQWTCVSGCASGVTTFTHAEKTISNSETELCNAKTGDCTIVVKVNWQPNTYTIQYAITDGTLGTKSPTSGTYDTVLQIDNPTRVGYKFAGWTMTDGNTSTAKYGTSNTNVNTAWSDANTKVTATYFKNLRDVSGTVKLTASWTARTDTPYVVNYYEHNLGNASYSKNTELSGTKTGTTAATVNISDLVKTIPGFTYEAAYVTGNTTKPTSGAVTSTKILADGTRVINLYYRRNYLYIQYDVNGGTLAAEHGGGYSTEGSLVTSTSNNPATKFLRGLYGGVVGNVTLSDYTTDASGLHNYNNSDAMNIFRTGYTTETGKQWNTKADGSGTNYDHASNKNYSANNFAGVNLANGDQTATIYVNWKARSFTVTLNNNDATTAGAGSVTVTYDSSTVSPSTGTTPVKSYKISGFQVASSRKSNGATVSSTAAITSSATFNGYYSAASGGVKVISGTNPYTLTNSTGYVTNGKWSANANKTLHAQFSAMETKKLPKITKTGFVCGWTTSSSGTTIEYYSEGNITPSQDMTLYGVCVEVGECYYTPTDSTYFADCVGSGSGVQCAVSLDNAESKWAAKTCNGGAPCTDVPNVTQACKEAGYQYGSVIINTPAASGNSKTPKVSIGCIKCPTGYEFSNEIDNGFCIKTSCKHTVSFNSNGGTSLSKSSLIAVNTYKYKSSPDKTGNTNYSASGLATVSRTGYNFTGWYTATSGGTKIENDTVVNLSSNPTLYARWDAIKSTVTLNSQNATSNGTQSVTATYGSAMPSITKPTKTGYTFKGYYLQTNGGGDQYYTATGASAKTWNKTVATTLYAYWTANTYTVTFDQNGGNKGTESITVTFGSAMPTITIPTKRGYDFTGYTNSSGTKYYNADGTSARTWNMTSDQTLKAGWSAKKTYVTLDKQGGSGGTETVTAIYGSAMPSATMPTRSGYAFQGYYKTEDGCANTGSSYIYYKADGTSARTWNIVSTATTLYACWVKTYTINLDSRGDTAAFGHATDEYGIIPDSATNDGWQLSLTKGLATNKLTAANNCVTLPTLPTPTKNNYVFQFWYIEKDINLTGTSSCLSQDCSYRLQTGDKFPVVNGANCNISSSELIADNSMTIYAMWGMKITLDANGGTFSDAGTFTVSSDKKTASRSNFIYGWGGATKYGALPTPTYAGYSFDGWYTVQSGNSGSKIVQGDPFIGDYNHTLYAHWTPIPYEVTFNSNTTASCQFQQKVNGTWTNYSKTVLSVNPADYSIYRYTSRTGYTFKGWDTSTSCSNPKTSGTTGHLTGNITRYACWSANSYTVTLDQNGGSGGTTSKSATYGSAMPSIIRPTKTGYTFGGYYTGTGGSGTQYYKADGTSAKTWDKTSATTLYAKWTANTYKINYAGGGTVSTKPTSATYDTTFNISNPTKTGYTFAGWTASGLNTNTAKYGTSTTNATNSWNGTTKIKATYFKNLTATNNATVTMTANWTARSFGITLNGQSPTTAGTGVVSATYGSAMPSITCPKKTGYAFGGYFTETGGKGTQYYTASCTSNKAWDIASATTLYAKWTNVTYTIAYAGMTDAAYGTYHPTSAKYGTAITISNPTKSGYTFNGWSSDPGAGGMSTSTAQYDVASGGGVWQSFCKSTCGPTTYTRFINLRSTSGTVTLTAKWTKKSTGGGTGGCFLPNTPIKTIDGYKAINKINVGDKILNYNEETGKNEYNKVLKVHIHEKSEIDEELYTLTLNDETKFKVTSTHGLYIRRNGETKWLRTRDVKIGDYLRYSDGTYHKIVKLSHKELTSTVYNLTVDNTHTFYVGYKEVLVHNISQENDKL
jgi:prepilin-type N-terminal cleavage/methylation domain-containing protein/uncharacterized repeat protein (TIGR02543 family)